MIIDEKAFKYMSSAAGEEDLLIFMIEELGEMQQNAARNAAKDLETLQKLNAQINGQLTVKNRQDFYWRAKMLEHAMLYIEDWKNSI